MLLVHYVNKEYTNICTIVVYVTQVWSGGGRREEEEGRKGGGAIDYVHEIVLKTRKLAVIFK